MSQIAYTEEYAEAMAYLRAIMAKDECSERALKITKHITEMNPAHYTVWLYRAKVVFALNADIRSEIKFLNDKALRHEKNYQIWHHRQMMMDKLGDPTGETEFISQMFEKDSKNYHVWSYRQWLVKRFDIWDAGELEYVEKLLEKDIRNNSAWNHRFFVLFGRGNNPSQEIIDREIKFTEEAIFLAPQNPSPWNYIRGVLSRVNMPLSTFEAVCKHYAPTGNPSRITSSHALDMLADIQASRPDTREEAEVALQLLAEKFDPIRTNYWNHRKVLLQKAGTA